MKTRIALGAGLLLTLGTAVAGTLMYGNGEPTVVGSLVATAPADATPEMMAMWKATAASIDYVAPKAPI